MSGELGPLAQRLVYQPDVAPTSIVDVVVTAMATPDHQALEQLAALGLSVSTVAGRILVGDVPVGRLVEVAAASAVRYIEVASSVWVDDTRGRIAP